jgi:hypothetical protein
MKKIKTIEFKEKKMIKRSPLNKYLIHSENNPQIGNNRRKNNYCQNLGISNERNEIKKIIDISMKEHIKNNNEKIINLDSNENSIDEVENEVIEIIESETKNQNNNLCKKIKFEENNDIILLSNNDDNDDENKKGEKEIEKEKKDGDVSGNDVGGTEDNSNLEESLKEKINKIETEKQNLQEELEKVKNKVSEYQNSEGKINDFDEFCKLFDLLFSDFKPEEMEKKEALEKIKKILKKE